MTRMTRHSARLANESWKAEAEARADGDVAADVDADADAGPVAESDAEEVGHEHVQAAKRTASAWKKDESESDFSSPARRAKKRRRTGAAKTTKRTKATTLTHKKKRKTTTAWTGLLQNATTSITALPPTLSPHPLAYHLTSPILLPTRLGRITRTALLNWFDTVSSARAMPWRQPFCPTAHRAYEVWISEMMLQQTRVSVARGYWERWMARWPTLRHVAAADREDVLAMWKGLGYYSRAGRIHEAARLVVAEMGGELPRGAEELERRIPGVGRYTAGAISAIVYGQAEAMVDGNALRVLSRQLGVRGDVKGDKECVEMLWAVGRALARLVAGEKEGGRKAEAGTEGEKEAKAEGEEEAKVEGEEEAKVEGEEDADAERDGRRDGELTPSDRPGRWGQGLMELGATVCTPKPNCGMCPIRETCRAYAEGALLARGERSADLAAAGHDIENACVLCHSLEAENGLADEPTAPPKQGQLSNFLFQQDRKHRNKPSSTSTTSASSCQPDARTLSTIIAHARTFPARRTAKKPVREQEDVVCAVHDSQGRYLVVQRPAKGLLGGLWELPSCTLRAGDARAELAMRRARQASGGGAAAAAAVTLQHLGEVGSVPWLFSHIRLLMHVHLFALEGEARLMGAACWVPGDELVDRVAMGRGMQRAFELARGAARERGL